MIELPAYRVQRLATIPAYCTSVISYNIISWDSDHHLHHFIDCCSHTVILNLEKRTQKIKNRTIPTMTTDISSATENSAATVTEPREHAAKPGLIRTLSGLNLRRRLSFSGLKELVAGHHAPEGTTTDESMDQSSMDKSSKSSMDKSTKRSLRRTKSAEAGPGTNERRRARRRNRDGGASNEDRPRRSRSKNSLRRNFSTSSEDSNLAEIDAMTSELEQMARLLGRVEDPSKILIKHMKISNTAA